MADPVNPWTIKSTRVAYQNPWVKFHEDSVITPTGKDGIYGYLESRDSIIIVPVNAQGKIFFIRSFRYPDKSWNWELPAGGGDDEHAIAASRRELEEETGILADKWETLGITSVCNGLMTERMTTLVTQDLRDEGTKEISDEQIIDAKFCSSAEVDRMIADGDINDGQTMTALFLFERWRRQQP